MKIQNKKFIYLISPNKIVGSFFYKNLTLIFKSNKVKFFQLRIKKESYKRKIFIAKKVLNICRKYKVKFIINDDPYITAKVNADGCHLGQKDMSLIKARKILKNKIIGVTCHNSLKLAKKAARHEANYVAIGAFYNSRTKKIVHRATISTLKKIKKSIKIPVVAIGGINQKNYKNLLLNKTDFLAISGYVWNNKKFEPYQAVKNLK